MKISKPEYLKKVAEIDSTEKERLLSRMSGKLPRRLQKEKLSIEDALAIQLEIEDEQLQEWREKMHKIRAKLSESLPKPAKRKKAAPGKEIAPAKEVTTAGKPVAPQKTAAAKATKPAVTKLPAKANAKPVKKTPIA